MGRKHRHEQPGPIDAESQRAARVAWLPVQTERGIISVREALRSPDWQVRCAGIERLGSAGGEWAVRELIAALDDRDERIAAAAAEALGHTGDDSAITPLTRQLRGRGWYRSPRLAIGLGAAAVATFVGMLSVALFGRESVPPGAFLIAALAAVSLIASTALLDRQERRRAAAKALGRIARRTHSPATRGALADLRVLRVAPVPNQSVEESMDTSYRDAIQEIEAHTSQAEDLPLPASLHPDRELPIVSEHPRPGDNALPRIGEWDPAAK